MTKQLIISRDIDGMFNKSIKIDPTNIAESVKILKTYKNETLDVYDTTHNLKIAHNERIEVKDHINKTGSNPLIGIQSQFSEPFIDISNIYSSADGVTAVCLGSYYDEHKSKYTYPANYLCYISILAKALGIEKINATLINKIDTKNHQ